jgi:hypothetical protein
MLAALDPGCIRPKDTIKRQYEGVRTWSPRYRTIDANGDAARRRQHAPHLAEGTPLIWKELQAQLAKNQIKFTCREWQIERTALDPINRRPLAWKRPGNRQHPLVKVQAGDVPLDYPLVRQTGNNSGSAGDVENIFAGLGLRATDKILRPFCCNRRHQVSLVKLRRAAIELPMVVIDQRKTLLGTCLLIITSPNLSF